MFGGSRIGICRIVLAAVLLSGVAMAVPDRQAQAQSGAQSGTQSGQVEPWQALSGEEQIRRFYLPRAQSGRAADQGDPRALYRLAVMLQTGDGIPKAPSRALALYRQAARQGVLEAYFNMAQMIERGEGVAADPAAAEGMFEQLAEAGMTEAMRELGRINAQKQDRDLPAAWFWFALAAANGDNQAGELARLLAGSMTEEDLAAGQKRLGKSLNK